MPTRPAGWTRHNVSRRYFNTLIDLSLPARKVCSCARYLDHIHPTGDFSEFMAKAVNLTIYEAILTTTRVWAYDPEKWVSLGTIIHIIVSQWFDEHHLSTREDQLRSFLRAEDAPNSYLTDNTVSWMPVITIVRNARKALPKSRENTDDGLPRIYIPFIGDLTRKLSQGMVLEHLKKYY